MKILVADDEAKFRDLISEAIRARTNHEVVTAVDGVEALELALATPRPDVLILDWVMPKMSGTQVCRLVRGSNIAEQPYILFVTARCRREELLQCLASGADDLLSKPPAPDVLLARIEIAERSGGFRAADMGLSQALREAVREGAGELVVRSGPVTGRVLVSESKIAWVHFADSFGTLFDELGPEAGLDSTTAQEVVAECRRTGAGLSQTLVSWGLVEGEQLREVARSWLKKKLSGLFSLERPQFLFLPGQKRCSAELLFDVEDLLEEVPSPNPLRATSSPPSQRSDGPIGRPSLIPSNQWADAFVMAEPQDQELQPLLQACMGNDGSLGVVVLDRFTGLCLGNAGLDLDPDVAWAHLRMLNALMLTEHVEDSHVSTEEHIHLLTLLPNQSHLVAYALFDSSETTVATARLALRSAIRIA